MMPGVVACDPREGGTRFLTKIRCSHRPAAQGRVPRSVGGPGAAPQPSVAIARGMAGLVWRRAPEDQPRDRKSTRLNSSHANISYAVFCLKKKKNNDHHRF